MVVSTCCEDSNQDAGYPVKRLKIVPNQICQLVKNLFTLIRIYFFATSVGIILVCKFGQKDRKYLFFLRQRHSQEFYFVVSQYLLSQFLNAGLLTWVLRGCISIIWTGTSHHNSKTVTPGVKNQARGPNNKSRALK